MKFLLDANIPYSAIEIFPSRFKVLHVRDIGLAAASDREIASWSKKNNAVIITRDLDFANKIIFPPGKHCGIVVIRVPYFYTAKDIKRVLQAFMLAVDEKEISKSLIIVQEGRHRIRK
jgi:predicted nuclease of predicted toxin-antitoxin system